MRGVVVNDYVVLLFAQNPVHRTVNRYFAVGRPGDYGRFTVGTLAPEDYHAIALDRGDPTRWQDPDFLDGLSRQATAFFADAGRPHVIDLRLFTLQ